MQLNLYIVFHSDGAELVAAPDTIKAMAVANKDAHACTVRLIASISGLQTIDEPTLIASCIQDG